MKKIYIKRYPFHVLTGENDGDGVLARPETQAMERKALPLKDKTHYVGGQNPRELEHPRCIVVRQR